MKKIAIAAALLAVAAAAAAQDDPVKTARDLYASAAYEEALSELSRVGSRAPAAPAREANVYRAFCLVALGRVAEAETTAESILRQDPMLDINQFPDASPRLIAIFGAVRKRVLPQLIRSEYKAARALAVANAPDAQPHLARVRELLDDAEKIGAWDDTLSDLRIVVDGFLDLRAARPADAPAPPPEPAGPAAPVEFHAGSEGVVPPVVVSQAPPRVPAGLLDLVKRLRRNGAVDVVINEKGRVENATLTQSINSAYDTLVLDAVRGWKYKPATKDGHPVRFVKTVVIDVNAQ